MARKKSADDVVSFVRRRARQRCLARRSSSWAAFDPRRTVVFIDPDASSASDGRKPPCQPST